MIKNVWKNNQPVSLLPACEKNLRDYYLMKCFQTKFSSSHSSLQRPVLLNFYKNSLGTHIDYLNAIFDGAYNGTFHQKLEPIQYKVCLAPLIVIKGLLRQNL